MSKPDWKNAPDWANYLAKDADGSYWWFEHTPVVHKGGKIWDAGDIYGDSHCDPAYPNGPNDGILTLDVKK